jgi:hypothetical protein
MKFSFLASLALLAASLASQPLLAQADYLLAGAPLAPAPADPAIAQAIAQISPQRIRHTIETLVSFGNRSTLSSMDTDLKPGTGVTAAADWIFAQFEGISKDCGGCLGVKRDTFTKEPGRRVTRPTTLTNVYAILRGSDPVASKRMYLVTGHYDSRDSSNEDTHGAAPGANDDASGVAVSLESARVLSKLHLAATLVFVAVAGEEQGLYGSEHLAQLAKSEGWQLEGVLNNDIVGGNTAPSDTLQRKNVVRIFSEGIPTTATPDQLRRLEALGQFEDGPSRELARAMADVARSYFPSTFTSVLVTRPDRYLRGGDHLSFNEQGFSAVRLTEWREDFNHQHQNVRLEGGVQFGDLPQYVDYEYVARVARLNAATLATLADSPGEPTDVKIVVANLENGTTLAWKAPTAPTPGLSYEVLWRETTASNWQRFLAVPAVAGTDEVTVHLPVSKDNVIFAVRAIQGMHRGIAVAP